MSTEESCADVCRWLVSMDDVENEQGMQDRRTVTLNNIILRAKRALASGD